MVSSIAFSQTKKFKDITEVQSFTKKNATLSVAESCSSGLIASYLASKSGCSQYFKGGIIAYNNIIKNEILDIEMHTIIKHTAVSSQVVSKMAENVSKKFNSEYIKFSPNGGSTKIKSMENLKALISYFKGFFNLSVSEIPDITSM